MKTKIKHTKLTGYRKGNLKGQLIAMNMDIKKDAWYR